MQQQRTREKKPVKHYTRKLWRKSLIKKCGGLDWQTPHGLEYQQVNCLVNNFIVICHTHFCNMSEPVGTPPTAWGSLAFYGPSRRWVAAGINMENVLKVEHFDRWVCLVNSLLSSLRTSLQHTREFYSHTITKMKECVGVLVGLCVRKEKVLETAFCAWVVRGPVR